MVVDHLLTLGPLAAHAGRDTAVDALWFFNDPAHYDALVRQCGWEEGEFTAWLAARMQNAVLDG